MKPEGSMIITEIIPYGKMKSRVLTDEDFAFSVYRSETGKLGLAEGAVLTQEFLDGTLLPLLTRRAKERVVLLLEKQDYPEAVLRRKLRQSWTPEACIDAAIVWAREKHYLDDRRFTENYLAWHASGKSRRRLFSDLLSKGIDRDLAAELLEQCPVDEETQIAEELRKKHYDPESADPKERSRMAAHLARHGYSWAQIESALRQP